MAISDKKRYVWTQDELDYIKSIQKDRAEALKNLADAIDKVLWELYEDRNCDY